MQIEILDHPPISGSIEEVRFDAIGTCTWVKFSEGSEEWVGVFGVGISQVNSVAIFSDNQHGFIIAGGQGYVVDLKNKSLSYKAECDRLQDAISIPERNLIIAADDTNLLLYDLAQKLWESERVAVDGIRFKDATPDNVYGYIWQMDGWYSFVFDVKRSAIISEEFVTSKWYGLPED